MGSIDDFSVTEPEEFDSEIQATIEQVPIIKQQTLTLGLSWTRKYKSGKGRVRTTFSTNKFQNIFSRFTNNIDKKGVVFENNSKEKESKIRIHFTEFSDELKFSYGFNFQHSLYTNSTSGVLNEINYNTSIDFLKYGFFGQISRSFYNNKLSISFGLRTDADSFSNGSGLLNNLSPRLSVSYIFSEDQKWKLNTSLGRYFKIPTYTMLGFKDSEDKFINRKNRYTQSNHCVIGLEYNLETTSRITLEGFLKDYSQYPVSVLDQVSIANKGGGFEVLGNEPIVDSGRGNTYGLELLFQQKLSRRVYGILAYTHFFSQFSRKNGPLLPTVWDSRNLLSFTGGYKLKRNWEFSLRYRYAGKTPYAKTNLALTSKSYPIIILDYNSLNYEKIGAFSQGDIRIDKKWNFKNLSFNFYIDIQNFLSQSTPEPQEYGLQRDIDGSIIIPRNIVPIDTDSPNSLIPSFGFVFDF